MSEPTQQAIENQFDDELSLKLKEKINHIMERLSYELNVDFELAQLEQFYNE